MRIVVRQRQVGSRRRAWWGVVLISVGMLFLLDRYGVLSIHDVWHYWPALLIVSGIGHLLWPDFRESRARGVFPILLGAWFFACNWHWYGLTYNNGWPLIMVAGGLSMLMQSLLERGGDARGGDVRGGEENHV